MSEMRDEKMKKFGEMKSSNFFVISKSVFLIWVIRVKVYDMAMWR